MVSFAIFVQIVHPSPHSAAEIDGLYTMSAAQLQIFAHGNAFTLIVISIVQTGNGWDL